MHLLRPAAVCALAAALALAAACDDALPPDRLDPRLLALDASAADPNRYLVVEPAELTFAPGQTAPLAAVLYYYGTPYRLAAEYVTWQSSDSSVATVSASGLVTALSPGAAKITATHGVSASATVSVVAPETSTPSAPTSTPAVTAGGSAELPRALIDTRAPSPTGRTLRVPAGGDLQGALDIAQPGDLILLAPGATFVGTFVLPRKAGAEWITVRTDGPIPAEGVRASPADAASYAKLVSATVSPALQTAAGAHHWRVTGLEITVSPSAPFSYGLVSLGDGSRAQNAYDLVPSFIVLDRMYIHGTPTFELRRCVALNSAWTAVIDSYVSDCHQHGFDSQALWGWNGPGPFKIVNNYLEASSEVLGFGGADPSIAGLVPSDVEVRGNYVTRPLSWKGNWEAKNFMELKAGQRVLVEGNVFRNNWVDAQPGFAVVLWSVNQEGSCTWCVTQDVTFRYNIVDNAAGGVNMIDRGSSPSIPMRRVTIAHTLFTNIGAPGTWINGRLFQLLGALSEITIAHNTGFAPNQVIFFADYRGAIPGLVIRDNIGGAEYPVFSAFGTGTAALGMFAGSGSQFARNVLVGGNGPADNFYPSSVGLVGFAGFPGDLRLTAGSPYRGQATDGTDPGVDFSTLAAKTTGVVTPSF